MCNNKKLRAQKRDKKKKPKMLVSGKSVFLLEKIIKNKTENVRKKGKK